MLTDQRVDEIFKEMDGYVLELANEPGMLGPQYFQDIIATCRNYLNKVSIVTSEVNRWKLAISSELRRLESAYALEYDDLLANDPRVKSLANIEDRKATVGFLLRAQRVRIQQLKDQMHSLDAVGKVVSFRTKELHATMSAIKDQRRLMDSEISSGAFYGDERPNRSRGSREPREATHGMSIDDDISASDLEAMLATDADAEPDPVPAAPVAEETVPDEVAAEAEVQTPAKTAEAEPDLESPEIVTTNAPSTSEPAAPVAIAALPVTDESEMLSFLDAADEPAPQAVVAAPKNKVSAPAEPKSDVDDFLSILEGL